MSSILVFLSKICKQIRIRKSLLVREDCVQAGTGQARKQARGGSVTLRPLLVLGPDGLAILQGHLFIVTPVTKETSDTIWLLTALDLFSSSH